MQVVDSFAPLQNTKLQPLRKMQNKLIISMNGDALLSPSTVVSLPSKFTQLSNKLIHASPKIKLVMAIHVAVIAAVVVFWKAIRMAIIEFVEKTKARVNGNSQKSEPPRDVSDDGSMEDRRVALEVAYARRKREEQEQARQSALMKGMDREATEVRQTQQRASRSPTISEILRKTAGSPTNLVPEPTVVPAVKNVPPTVVTMNAAKQRELAAIEQRKRQQDKMMANTPMAPSQSTAQSRDDLRADQARRLLKAVLSVEASAGDDDNVAVALELQRQKLADGGEKNRKLTSMMATSERDAKRLTESALANVKAKVADVVEQRLESEEKEEELRYAQEWAAAVSSKKKESSGQVKSSIYSALQAVVDRSRQFWLSPIAGPSDEEALAMYQNKVKAQQQAAAQKNARSKGQALEGAEIMAMKSKMSHEEAEAKARMEEEMDRQVLATALRRKEGEEAAAAISYAKTVKRLEDAKRARANNKLKALEQAGEYVRQPAPSVPVIAGAIVATATSTGTASTAASTYASTPTTAEQEALAMYAKKINPTKFANSATTEAEALALYQKSLKAQQHAAAVINARNKGKALEGAEQMAMKSKMSHEEAEAKARLEEKVDRQARATAVRRREAEEAAAAISYAKSVKRLDDSKRVRAINKLKALEQAGEYVRQPAPSVDAVVPVIASATIATATAGTAASTYASTPTTAEQEALAMYAKKINPTKVANSATTEAEALALYQKSLKAQQQAAAQKLARSKGQALEGAEIMAMKSKMSHEEAEAKARMEEEEDRQARATAVRRKEGEEAAAAISYAKSVKRLDDAKRARAINKLKALEQAGEYVRQPAPSIASQFVLSTSTTDPKEEQARRLLNAIIGVEALDKLPEAVASVPKINRLEKTTDKAQVDKRTTVRAAEATMNLQVSKREKTTPQAASRTVMDFVVSALRAVQKLV